MKRRHLMTLLACSFLAWWPGMGLMPLLPVYAKQLGATPAMVGNYLAFVFAALTLGTICVGPIASRWQNRRLLIAVQA